MTYVKYGVKLSIEQKKRLAKALSQKSALTIRLSRSDLSGNDYLNLTKTQLKRLQKAMKNRTGVDLKISKTQIRYLVQEGGSLWSSLINLGMRALPYASRAVSKLGPALATGAAQALGSLGIDKIFGNGIQTGEFLVPQNKIDQLIKYKDMLTKKQKEQIVSALHTGGQLVIKPTKSQSGGFLGTLLTSIGIPLILNALTGKGLQVDRHRSKRSTNVYVPPSSIGISAQPKSNNSSGGLVLPMNQLTGMYPPPFIGSWKKPVGMGLKKKEAKSKKGQRTAIRKKQPIQQHTINRSNSVNFINKPLSNFDLLNWVDYLGIKHFKGVFSRDSLPHQIKNNECGIVNLDSKLGSGTHWVAYRNGKSNVEYFDSFGLEMPFEVAQYLDTSGKQIYYSGDEIQERDSVLCGYWCLYYLLERQKGVSMLNVIHNVEFDFNNQIINNRFIINDFKNI